MPPWLILLGQGAAACVAIAAVLTLVWRGVRVARRISRGLDALVGAPESLPGAGDARLGMLQRLAGVEASVDALRADGVLRDTALRAELAAGQGALRAEVAAGQALVRAQVAEVRQIAEIAARELQPNGGSSTRDLVADIHRRATADPTP